MPSKPAPVLLELLYDALHSPLGVVVETSNPVLLRQKLYPLRKEDEALKCIAFVISPTQPDRHLWLVKQPEKVVAEEN